jgi:hypothetical protein
MHRVMEPNDLRFFTMVPQRSTVCVVNMIEPYEPSTLTASTIQFPSLICRRLNILKDSLLFFAFKTLTGLQTAAVALLYKDDTVMTLFMVLDAGHFISEYISYMNRSIIR